jgi:AraC-like DNA-binding protein
MLCVLSQSQGQCALVLALAALYLHFGSLPWIQGMFYGIEPLRYQKQLRLVAARERMLIERLDAVSAAFEVGYESPSQFNREYKRFFGQPPMHEIKARRFSKSTTIRD